MSSQWTLINRRTNKTVIARASVCAGFFSRWRGLQFRQTLEENEALIFLCSRPGYITAAIHTLGMRYSIGIVWLDVSLRVVDLKLAKPWRLAYVPKAPAMYYVEANPAILDRVRIGDQLKLVEVDL